jgi:hypothetical protein
MPGDKPKFSDRGREKASSQSQTRDFIRARSQKQHGTERLGFDKKRVILKGGMDQGETSNQNKTLEQRRDEALKKAEDIANYHYSWANYFHKKHRDYDTLQRDLDNIDIKQMDRESRIHRLYESRKKDESSEQQ